MSDNQEISRQQTDRLIHDAEYLLDEAEALKYVIDSVPYEEAPPEGLSILRMLQLIDHAQVNYYRPLIEKVFSENRLIKLNEFEHYSDSFSAEEEEKGVDIQKVLDRIVKHRAGLLTVIKKISLVDWARSLRDTRGDEILLYDFATNMVQNERKILKEIADLVWVYQNDKQTQREINKKASRNQTS